MLKFLNWVLKRFGVKLYMLPYLDDGLIASAKELMYQVDGKEASGEFKRAQVLRALMNRHPTTPERVLALAIEVIICSGV